MIRVIPILVLSSALAFAGVRDDTQDIQDAISKKPYDVFIKPGTYHLSKPLIVPSGARIHGAGPATILKKRLVYSHVFVNDSAPYHGTNWNSDIVLSDFTIDCNGKGTQAGAAEVTANGHIQFSYCRGITVDRVRLINGDPTLYAIHLQNATNVTLSRITLETEKDGIHIGPGCESVGIYDSYLTTGDDAIAIMPEDYPRVQNRCDDIFNVMVRNVSLRPAAGHPWGAGIAFYIGSWDNWAPANVYRLGDKCQWQGNIYKSVVQGTNAAIVPPTHTTFTDVKGADGITWRWLQAGTNLTSNIHNVLLEGIWRFPLPYIHSYTNDPQFNMSVYPGTEGTAVVTGLQKINVN